MRNVSAGLFLGRRERDCVVQVDGYFEINRGAVCARRGIDTYANHERRSVPAVLAMASRSASGSGALDARSINS
jgi:hypothetical protein